MSSILNNLFIELKHGVERHENRPLLKCAMAACALVAEADGVVSFSERVCLDNILETLEALKIFNPHEGVNLFNGFVDDIRADPVKGRLKALKAISDVGPSRKTAELLMKVCIAIATSDNLVPDEEKRALDDVSKAAGLPVGRHMFLVA